MKKVSFWGILFALPNFAWAQDGATRATAEAASFVSKLNEVILFPTIALLSSVAFLVFIFGCFQYIALSDNEQARQKGVAHITWGIVGLVVMLSAYAILSVVVGTFGLQGNLDTANEGGAVIPLPEPAPDTTGSSGDGGRTGGSSGDGGRTGGSAGDGGRS